jgi:type IV pilus assembly protein PilX
MRRALPFRRRQRGAALLVALCVVVVLMLLGASAARNAGDAERASRGDRDRAIAFQAAEAALADAERDIALQGGPGSQRSAMLRSGIIPQGCGGGAGHPAVGVCGRVDDGKPPAWLTIALADPTDQHGVPYGRFTGHVMPVGAGSLPARLPRYLIEAVSSPLPGEDADAGGAAMYRVTAIGFGPGDTTEVVLQSIVRHPGAP